MQIREISFSFQMPGDHTQEIRYSDAKNYLMNNTNATRREYPLVLMVHALIGEDSREFFQLVKRQTLQTIRKCYFHFQPIQIVILHVKSSITTDPPTRIINRISKLSNGKSLIVQVPSTSSLIQMRHSSFVGHLLLRCIFFCRWLYCLSERTCYSCVITL